MLMCISSAKVEICFNSLNFEKGGFRIFVNNPEHGESPSGSTQS